MKKELIDELFSEKERLSGYIQTFYEKFDYYNKSEKPQILLVSSSNSLKNNIDEFFDKSCEDYDIKSYCSDDLEKNTDDIIFSDCIIVCTTALKIAPSSLYNVCKFASKFRKKTYVLLGGWNQIVSTTEKVRNKIEEVKEILYFMDFVNIFAVRKMINCDGLYEFPDASNKIIENIFTKFDTIRNEQENAVFAYAKEIVKSELENLDNNLFDEIQNILSFKNTVMAKQNGYKVELKNASVPLTDISSDIYNFCNNKLSHSYSKFFSYEEYTAKSYIEMGEVVKGKMIEELNDFFDSYKSIPEKIIEAKGNELKTNCVQQLNELGINLSKIKNLSENSLEELRDSINDVSAFDDFNKSLLEIYSSEIDDVKDAIFDKIHLIIFDSEKIGSMEKIKDAILQLRHKIGDARNKNIESSDNSDNESNDNESNDVESNDVESVEYEIKNDDYGDESESKDIESNEIVDSVNESTVVYDIQNESVSKNTKKLSPQEFCEFFVLEATSICMKYSNDLIHNANTKIKESSISYVNKYFGNILYFVDKLIEELTSLQKRARKDI